MSALCYSPAFEDRMRLWRTVRSIEPRRHVTISAHIQPGYLVIQREGGEPHVTDGTVCNCMAGRRNIRCWAVRVVQSAGGVGEIRRIERMDDERRD